MAQNSLFPAFVKLFYEGGTGNHTQTIPILMPTETPLTTTGWSLEARDGSFVDFEAAVVAYINIVRVFMPTNVTFLEAELYTMATATADPLYRTTATISLAGQAVANLLYNLSQTTLSYRSELGGSGKLVYMESTLTPNFRSTWRLNVPTTYNALRAFLIGQSNWIIARDGGMPIGTTYVTTKTNDAVRRNELFE